MTKGEPLLAGVMGAPIGHSLSPILHGHWIAELGLKAHYVPLPVQAENLTAALRALPAMGFRGVNLTIPHKERAIQAMDILGPEVAHIGAVNTVIVDAQGRLTGRNTDAQGYRHALIDAGASDIADSALILGAGGAARAVIYALWLLGVRRMTLANRTRPRAEALVQDLSKLDGLSIAIGAWPASPDQIAAAALVVNTTAAGMAGHPPLEFPISHLSPGATVSDIVYRPLMTPLLKSAAECGHRIVDGLGMLMHQAVPAFEAWFGVAPRVTLELRRKLLHALGET